MDIFESLLHTITWGIASLVDLIFNAFMYLAGIGRMTDMTDNQGSNIIGNDFISQLINTSFNGGITFNTIYLQFMTLGIVMLVVSLIVGVIKTLVNKEDEVKSRKLVYQKSCTSLLYMVATPFIFMLCVWGASVIITTITNIMVVSAGVKNDSISNLILGSCYTGVQDVSGINWIKLSNYHDFKQAVSPADYSHWLALLGSGCALVGFLMVTFTVVERIIHLLFLYLISPFVFAKTPLDSGKSFEQWRDLMLAKFFSLAGIIVCVYLFFILQKMLQGMENVNSVVILLFLIGGVFTFTKAGTLVSHLISQGTGNFEGMSQQTSMGMLNSGLRMVEHTAMGIGRGAMMGVGQSARAVRGATQSAKGMSAGMGVKAGTKAGASLVDGQAVKGATAGNGMGLAEASQNMAMMDMANQGMFGGADMTPYYMGASGMLGYMAGKLATQGIGKMSNAIHKVGESSPVVNAKFKIGRMSDSFKAKHPTASAVMSAPYTMAKAVSSQHKGKKEAKLDRKREMNTAYLERQANAKTMKQNFVDSNIALGKASFADKERQKEEKKNNKNNKKGDKD